MKQTPRYPVFIVGSARSGTSALVDGLMSVDYHGYREGTLLSLISGILKPTEGQVLVDGQPVTGPSRKVGYMLQQDYLFEWRTILENAVIGAEIQGADMGKARERATQLLTRYGLGQFLQHLPRQLSGGMRQRVALARTLCTEPDVVLLDLRMPGLGGCEVVTTELVTGGSAWRSSM